jgi:hypothetical protein
MFLKKILLILILIQISENFEFMKGRECLIRNEGYFSEFLYITNDKYDQNKRWVYTRSLNKIESFDNFRWNLLKLENNSYYLNNIHFNEFLCASKKVENMVNIRRLHVKIQKRFVYTIRLNEWQLQFWKIDECKWKLSRKNEHVFEIINVKYNEPLFAYYLNKGKRSVYLSSFRVTPESLSHKWNIECSMESHL